MRTRDFDYNLPERLIAQTPLAQRDTSRLLVYHRESGQIEHRVFHDALEYLGSNDVLVVNDTRVLPARLLGKREDTGGKMEFLLLKRLGENSWEVLVKPGRSAQPGNRFVFGEEGELTAVVTAVTAAGNRHITFCYQGIFEEVLDRVGVMPLPPYIHATLEDRERYQTVYARSNGSSAAPTAGLHFTPELLGIIQQKGVEIVPVLLHVGLGTFRPVKVEDVASHAMHAEYYEVSEDAARRINAAREKGGRVVCVGTTSARTLETVTGVDGVVSPGSGWTQIFIYPGYRFKAVDSLITNFHLPQSTLLMMVAALCGQEEILRVYREAVEQEYRFFSFGDAMLVT